MAHVPYPIKELPRAAIPGALAKAERYRLLNEPYQAESICRDILATAAGGPQQDAALVMLLLALTDQFPDRGGEVVREAQSIPPRLPQEYERHYYAGIVCERWANAQMRHMPPHGIYHWLREAMTHFERAQALAPPDNPDAVLRWNSCARVLNANPEMVAKSSDEPGGEGYGWDEPPG
jgi:hypothetical protein